MMTYGEMVVKLDSFSNLIADERAWPGLDPGRFIPGESAPPYPLIGGWMEPKVGLRAAVKARNSYPCRKSNHVLSVVQPDDILTEVS